VLKPMLASLADAPLVDPELVYEPKYDGIRAVAEVDGPVVRLWSRLGHDKAGQFPEVTEALARWARRRTVPVVLDGEIVALDAHGEPAGFQQLQGRIHVDRPSAAAGRVAYVAFDLLREGATDWRDRPLVERRAALERIFSRTGSAILRTSEVAVGDGRALHRRALDRGWEGLLAKRASSIYRSGKRSPDWRKLKILHEQEFVIGGWTEPRQTRTHFGALLLGVYGDGGDGANHGPHALTYVGHTGTGFTERELARLMSLLRPLETDVCPFGERPPTNERPHWVEPTLVAQVKFTEWTADARLRHPVYLGLRDDKRPEEIRREPTRRLHRPARSEGTASGSIADELTALERSRRNGVLQLPGGARLAVTNLHKVLWPREKLTKGDLFRYYAAIAPALLPAVADRALVMKRYPDGVAAKPFYQHRVADVPEGVRVETVAAAGEAAGRPQLVGGDLTTLLYMTQLAAISQDPWFSRVQSPQDADYAAFDLDPMPDVPFALVLDVARWIRDELQTLEALGVPKTSGADGLHVYVPLRPGTPYEAGLLFCQIVATVVADRHPKAATIERSVGARGRRVYVDYLQNVRGKTLATAYSARASEYAGVSTPLTWAEVDRGVRREDFTIRTVPARVAEVGDLWAALRRAPGVDLARVVEYAKDRQASPRRRPAAPPKGAKRSR
jgi:bifunctional non-homologous end joining protein LigD